VDAFTLWFTGLSGAGKTTLATFLKKDLLAANKGLSIEILDGDVLRKEATNFLGFSKVDRFANIKIAAYISKLLNKNGIVVFSSFITPYQNMRDYCRENIKNYLEVFVDANIDVLMKRDVKGLYKKALKKEIDNFTGISDDFEKPINPDIVVKTDELSIEESVGLIKAFLKAQKYI